jgi:hypothetical protein
MDGHRMHKTNKTGMTNLQLRRMSGSCTKRNIYELLEHEFVASTLQQLSWTKSTKEKGMN